MLIQRNQKQENQTRLVWLLMGVGVTVVLTMACSMGILPADAPMFTPPSEQNPTPVLTVQPPEPTRAVEATKAGTGTGGISLDIPPAPEASPTQSPPVLYYTQAGDTLSVVAVRFGVDPAEIKSPDPLQIGPLLRPNQLLIVPNRLVNTTSPQKLLPDSELVFSPSALDLDIDAFVQEQGGYLSGYKEWLGMTEWTSGANVVYRVALENSINPRLLLALLEYQSGWVSGQPGNLAILDYPLGKIETQRDGLYQQLAWAVNQLSIGYYGWREGRLTEIQFSDGVTARLAPDLNAGTVALQYYFAQVYDTQGWVQALDPTNGFPALYERMFGSPWVRALQVEPLYPPDLVQPDLILPFFFGQLWSYTGGPHGAWEHDGAMAALDFAPAGDKSGCQDTNAWVLAVAPGQVVRSDNGVVVIDLDGDGFEQTGWAMMYLHVATEGRITNGTWVETGDLIGKPSCEGGKATGTHVHIARKYNGEWIAADGPLPFILDGWMAHAGGAPYQGSLTRDGTTVTASTVGSFESRILRLRNQP